MNLTVSSSPHIKGNDSTRRIMRDVVAEYQRLIMEKGAQRR